MIDIKKIDAAADKFVGTPTEDTKYESFDLFSAFHAGAAWFAKAIWRTPQEIPEEDELIITEFWDAGNCYELENTTYIEDWLNHCDDNQIVKWCYIKDLLPPTAEDDNLFSEKGGDK